MTKQNEPDRNAVRDRPVQCDALGSLLTKAFELADCVGADGCNLRERWNNRLVLERSSLAELYLDGRINIALYGDWCSPEIEHGVATWLCSVENLGVIAERIGAETESLEINASNRDVGDEEIMLVVIVESMKRPQMIVRAIARPYLIEKKVYGTGQGHLYRCEISTGFPTSGYKVFPVLPHREMNLASTSPWVAVHNASGKVIQCAPKVVESVPYDQREDFRDRLDRAILKPIETMNIRITDDRVVCTRTFNDLDAVKFGMQRGGQRDKFINVALGPLNL